MKHTAKSIITTIKNKQVSVNSLYQHYAEKLETGDDSQEIKDYYLLYQSQLLVLYEILEDISGI